MDKCTKNVMVISIIISLLLCVFLICYGSQYAEHGYSLTEINEGVYAIYYNTHSYLA